MYLSGWFLHCEIIEYYEANFLLFDACQGKHLYILSGNVIVSFTCKLGTASSYVRSLI